HADTEYLPLAGGGADRMVHFHTLHASWGVCRIHPRDVAYRIVLSDSYWIYDDAGQTLFFFFYHGVSGGVYDQFYPPVYYLPAV
ncbi:MAG: hypothetical protein KDD76_05625, partial [Rickettsiales bacterium]|nr:hypothetical protein [Rickettsiales bacterium]